MKYVKWLMPLGMISVVAYFIHVFAGQILWKEYNPLTTDIPAAPKPNAPTETRNTVNQVKSTAKGAAREESRNKSTVPQSKPRINTERTGTGNTPVNTAVNRPPQTPSTNGGNIPASNPAAQPLRGNAQPPGQENGGMASVNNSGIPIQPVSGGAKNNSNAVRGGNPEKKPDAFNNKQPDIGQGTAKINNINNLPHKSKGKNVNNKNRKTGGGTNNE